MQEPTFDDVQRASQALRPWVHRTPVLSRESLDRRFAGSLFFKCENLQEIGAFKIRGATNAVLALEEEAARRGVLTHSSGNHGAALALAARRRGIPAYVVMPEGAPRIKREAVEAQGARVVTCPPTMEGRQETAARLGEETGANLVHPFDDPRVIAGQGTVALELLEQVADLDLLLVPVGGGGLAAGCALAAAAVAPGCQVVGVEPAGADDAARSLASGRREPLGTPRTLADGLRGHVGLLTFPLLKRLLAGIVTVSEEAIADAMRLAFEHLRLVVEPSGAVPLAALLEGRVDTRGRRVGIVLSGGNVDLDHLPWASVATRGAPPRSAGAPRRGSRRPGRSSG